MCCAIAALLLALFPAWNGGREAVLAWLGNTRSVVFAGAGMFALASGTAFAAGAYPQQAAHICSVLTGF